MSVQVTVADGAERGWSYVLLGDDITLGTAPDCGIRFMDPTWAGGVVRIQQRPGGYLLVNQLPHPLLLNGSVVPVHATRALHDRALLQPTAQTLLQVQFVPPPKNVPPVGVVATAPQPPQRSWLRHYGPACVLLLLTVGVWYGLRLQRQPAPISAADATPHKEWLHAQADRDPSVWGQTATDFTEAVYLDARGDTLAAQRRYHAIRAHLDRVALNATPPERDELAPLRTFVGQRLQAARPQ